jgi:lysyl-tRNA synthetase class 2
MASLSELREERLKKIKLLQEAGKLAYPIHIFPVESVSVNYKTIAGAIKKENFDKLVNAGDDVLLVGRVRAIRIQGSIIFLDLEEGGEKIQPIFTLKEDDLGGNKSDFDLFVNTIDIGDWISVRGPLAKTKRGEKSLLISDWQMLAKSLRPLPDKWAGLQDVEERSRRRYLDLIMDKAARERFVLRSKLVTALRKFLDEHDFLEVETPILQPQAGGASAEPFITHHNALDTDFYLRIAEELYLKRLLVGGFSKVYSINKNFRNEGIDATHNPEFTMLEWYEAFSTAAKQREFVEKLFKFLLKELDLDTVLKYNDQEINFDQTFAVKTYYQVLREYAGIEDPHSVATEPGETVEKALDRIYKKQCRPKLVQPTFIIDYPKDYLPLAKNKEDDPSLVDAFQLVAGGVELVKAFSELNDPQEQQARFKQQEANKQAGDTEAQTMDDDFIEALEYGMPPAGGVGIGIDRLAMLLTDTHNIRDIILFPTLKPR